MTGKPSLQQGAARLQMLRRWVAVLVVRGLGGVAGVLATITATRLLGAEQAGLVFLALAIVTVVAALARLGLDNALVRFMGAHIAGNNWHSANGVFRKALQWTLLSTLASGAALFLLAPALATHVFRQPQLAGVLHWMAWLVPLLALYWLHGQALVGARRPEMATTVQNISLPLSFAGLLLLLSIQTTPDAGAAAACYLAAGALTLALALLAWWRQPGTAWRDSEFPGSRLWQSAAPLWVVVAMSQAVLWSGQIAAGAWLSPTDVAHLAAAQRTAMLISLVLTVTNMMVAPRFAALHQTGDMAGLQRLARLATRLMVIVATPAAMLMTFFATPIMGLFGDGFAVAAPLLLVLVAGQWINAVTGSVGLLLTMTGHERDLRSITLLSGSVGIVLAIALTPACGAIGAAWATALAIIVQNIAALFLVRWRLGFWTVG